MQHPEENRAPTLKTGAVQKQVAGQLWPTGHGRSALAHINNHSTDLIYCTARQVSAYLPQVQDALFD